MNTHIDRWLDAYLDDELDPGLREQVEDHMKGCPHCQEQMAQRQALSKLLQQVPAAQDLMPQGRFVAEVGLLLDRRSQPQPPELQEMRQWLFNSKTLNLGWLAIPVGLLLASIFIQAVAGMSSLLALVPGPHQEFMRQLTLTPAAPVLENARLWGGMLGGLGWFELLQWNWVSELLALGAISLLYLAWLAGWLVHTQRRYAWQVQLNSTTGRQ